MKITAKQMGIMTEEVKIGGAGPLYLSATQVQEALALARKTGWEIHSIVAAPHEEDRGKSFIVILKK